ncbi:MAG: hypothetical protein KKE17_10275 [Proteobacteria bacterium]|nr:hypothetical protein [Pseudomonadota bacterium]MBU1710377.1 hypothetical protein [Pseudomonadota bacterium]
MNSPLTCSRFFDTCTHKDEQALQQLNDLLNNNNEVTELLSQVDTLENNAKPVCTKCTDYQEG